MSVFYITVRQNIFDKEPAVYEEDTGVTLDQVISELGFDGDYHINVGEGDKSYKPSEGEMVNITLVPGDPVSIATVVVSVGISLIAGFIAYKLFMDPDSDSDVGDSRIERITGAKNRAKPYSVVPVIAGKRRVSPQYASIPYTEIVGGDEWFNAIFCVGLGPLKLSDFRIGETSLSSYEHQLGVVDWFENKEISDVYQQIPRDIVQDSINIELLNPLEAQEGDNPNVIFNIPYSEGWLERTTLGPADEVVNEFSFPRGAVRQTSSGTLSRVTCVQYQYQDDSGWLTVARVYREVSSSSEERRFPPFSIVRNSQDGRYYLVNRPNVVGGNASRYYDSTSIDLSGIDITSFIEETINPRPGQEYLLIRGYTNPITSNWIWTNDLSEQLRFIVHYAPSSSMANNESVSIRARKVFPIETPNDSSFVDSVVWDNSKAIRNTTLAQFTERYLDGKPPKVFDGQEYKTYRPVLLALRIKATGQLNSSIEDLNVLAESVVPTNPNLDWRKWTDYIDVTNGLTTTNNPADLYRWFLQGPGQESPVSNDRLDLDSIQDWKDNCISEGWEISSYIDYESTLLKEIRNVAFTGRAEFSAVDSLYGVSQKIKKLSPVQVFTPKNSWGFNSSRVYPDKSDGIRFEFENEEQDYQKDEGLFYDPLIYNPPNTDNRVGKFTGVEYWGIAKPELAYRHARFGYYERFLRREAYSFSTDFENIVCTRGDMVHIQNDVINRGIGSGRVTGVGSGQFSIDETIGLVVGESYGVEFRTAVVNNDETLHLISATYQGNGTFTGDIPSFIEVGDFVLYGELGNEVIEGIVKDIQYKNNLEATIVCVNAANELFDLDEGAIPQFDSGVGGRPDWQRPNRPTNVSVSLDEIGFLLRVNVRVGSIGRQNIQSVELQYRSSPIEDNVASFNTDWRSLIRSPEGVVTPFEIRNIARGTNWQFRARVVEDNGSFSDFTNPIFFTIDSDPADLPVDILLEESINTPPTDDSKFSTIGIYVTPPNDPNYLEALVEYRISGDESWNTVGRTSGTDDPLTLQVLADGSSYAFRAKSVSVFNEVSPDSISSFITVANTIDPDYDEGDPGKFPVPNVGGLELVGQGNGTIFTGRDPQFTWRHSELLWGSSRPLWGAGLPFGSSALASSVGSGLGSRLDSTFKDYLVRILANGVLLREEYVTDNSYTYSFEKNVEDYRSINNGFGAFREFTIEVYQRTNNNTVSPEGASLTVSNPPPELPEDLKVSVAFSSIVITYKSEPSDLDFEGLIIWASEDSEQGEVVYRGGDQYIALEGEVFNEDGDPLFQIQAGQEYRIDVVAFDSFGYVGLAPKATFMERTLPIFDRDTDKTVPCPPANVSVSVSSEANAFVPYLVADVSWDESVGEWVDGACLVERPIGILTGYRISVVDDGDTSDVTEYFAGAESVNISIRDLQPNKNYSLKVRAEDWAGNVSPWSDSISFSTFGTIAAPDNVTNVNVTEGLDKIIVSWTLPSNADWQSTLIYLGTTSDFTAGPGNLVYDGMSDTAVISDVTNGQNYWVRLQAKNSSGVLSSISGVFGPVSPFKVSNINIENYFEEAAIGSAYIGVLDAGKITTGTLDADRIGANTIEASKLNVTQLSAISANLGNVTAGSYTAAGSGSSRVVLDSNGVRAFNTSNQQTFSINTNGSATIGFGSNSISVSTTGNVNIPGNIVAGTLTGNIFRTSSGLPRAEMGPDLNNYMFRVLDSDGDITFGVRLNGSITSQARVEAGFQPYGNLVGQPEWPIPSSTSYNTYVTQGIVNGRKLPANVIVTVFVRITVDTNDGPFWFPSIQYRSSTSGSWSQAVVGDGVATSSGLITVPVAIENIAPGQTGQVRVRARATGIGISNNVRIIGASFSILASG